jgi:hypothetical protein
MVEKDMFTKLLLPYGCTSTAMHVLLKDFSLASTWMQNQIQLKSFNINEIMPLDRSQNSEKSLQIFVE